MDQQENPDKLLEFEQEIFLDPVPKGTRLLNWIIDLIFLYVVNILFYRWLIGYIVLNDMDAEGFHVFNRGFDGYFARYIVWVMLILLYFTIFEGASKGRSIGKLMTGTVAVREDGSPVSWMTAFLRSCCRIIPFEPFSGFGGALWHDHLTGTIVVKKKK